MEKQRKKRENKKHTKNFFCAVRTTISRPEQKFPLQKESKLKRGEEKKIKHNNPGSLKIFEPTKMCYHNKMLLSVNCHAILLAGMNKFE